MPQQAATTRRPRAHDWWPAFFEAYGQVGNVTDAATRAGVEAVTARSAKHRYPEFRQRLEEAEAAYCDRIRREIYRRAVVGVDKPVFGTIVDANGNRVTGQVGTVREYSDRMLELEARAKMPEVYGERLRVDVASEARRIARELGATPEEEDDAVREAERILQRRREELRRKV